MRFLILTGLWATLVACSSTEAARSDDDRTPVRVASVVAGETTSSILLEGVTRAANRAVLSLQQPGRLADRPVRIGDAVARGQVLARLDARPWRHQLEATGAQLEAAEERVAQLDRDLARLTELESRGSFAGADLESLESRARAARREVDALRVQRDEAARQVQEAMLTAPFAGTVVAVHAETGEVTGAGQPLIELAGDGLEVAVQVPETAWVQLTPDTPVQVRLPALRAEVDASIVDLAGAGAREGLFPVTVGFAPPPRAVAGLTAAVRLALPVDDSLVVPIRAVVDPTGDRASVFRVVDHRAERVPVTLTGIQGDSVRLRGLASGDQVIVAGHAQLVDATPVQVQP